MLDIVGDTVTLIAQDAEQPVRQVHEIRFENAEVAVAGSEQRVDVQGRLLIMTDLVSGFGSRVEYGQQFSERRICWIAAIGANFETTRGVRPRWREGQLARLLQLVA